MKQINKERKHIKRTYEGDEIIKKTETCKKKDDQEEGGLGNKPPVQKKRHRKDIHTGCSEGRGIWISMRVISEAGRASDACRQQNLICREMW